MEDKQIVTYFGLALKMPYPKRRINTASIVTISLITFCIIMRTARNVSTIHT